MQEIRRVGRTSQIHRFEVRRKLRNDVIRFFHYAREEMQFNRWSIFLNSMSIKRPSSFSHMRWPHVNCPLYMRVTGAPADPPCSLSCVAAPQPVRSVVTNLPVRSSLPMTATLTWHFPGPSELFSGFLIITVVRCVCISFGAVTTLVSVDGDFAECEALRSISNNKR